MKKTTKKRAKKTPKILVSYRLPRDMVDWIERMHDASGVPRNRIVEAAVRLLMKDKKSVNALKALGDLMATGPR